ncbi:hypothetical protein DTO012A7_6056 [Penicillium roqueforti]|uniref:uncharacterized protein n=1 Tax=Penicillium roqueforti TaxID=5082 RepID=UPI00190B4902|nr:uncharacterized protein LCP9604111_3471 [Penicillium roqueforti]KAF9250569.1 hypothetical protein LCP9604111_3471 [Penicillium roqueforti]KAI2678959.1 hypothetical protein LCP963914a_7538 [Penicillium roqueforti]KAI2711834.1 hypothetical protein CBS147332_5470 [Penicillium roqueforti]KAI2727870.1 hypothetical protein CBS147354_2979 [Penicillium roqueforti]KAI3107971.1 hypothetical protein CBS147331_6072 [Penicillium roqueforti]
MSSIRLSSRSDRGIKDGHRSTVFSDDPEALPLGWRDDTESSGSGDRDDDATADEDTKKRFRAKTEW